MAEKKIVKVQAVIERIAIKSYRGNKAYEVALRNVESKKELVRYISPVTMRAMRDENNLDNIDDLVGKTITMQMEA